MRAAVLRAAAPALDEVTVPALVHFDLWPGNILVDRPADGPARIGGLIDGERMFWGDPLADLVSLALLDDIRRDEAASRASSSRATAVTQALVSVSATSSRKPV